ncbi:MAG: DUF4915 domain-containing protein, partial [Anaerolineales bacterium]
TTQGAWWETLAAMDMTLIVTREYEHLVLALTIHAGEPQISFMQLPHPSGLAYDAKRAVLYLAATRNPNQVMAFQPVVDTLPRADMPYDEPLNQRPLVPVQTRFYPGSLYIHDLAFIGDRLHANAVGQNAVIAFDTDGTYQRVWHPRCIEHEGHPVFEQNHIQLNSIAAGDDLAGSYFSASLDYLSARRPGHQNFPVDGRGVIFSGATREVVARGLTRPHSARFYADTVWVDNSGYGELGYIEDGHFHPVFKLPGWTRGLAFHESIGFVGTSRVLPRFAQYAPGLNVADSTCALHAIDMQSGQVLGSITWPYGNQLFAIELVPRRWTLGFPFQSHQKRATARERKLFYTFMTEDQTHEQ